ncbi:hypothetical protein [Jannaschia sp. M317]|nr:hypothetical protein [Jannaschia sp. M317]UWQ16974.1 hypothetical protein K3551_13885 [Jannaschia sp. M317]
MTNLTALILALLLIAFVLADALFNGGGWMIFLGRRMLLLVEALAFWR